VNLEISSDYQFYLSFQEVAVFVELICVYPHERQYLCITSECRSLSVLKAFFLLAIIYLLVHSLLEHVGLRMTSDVLKSLWWFRHLVSMELSLCVAEQMADLLLP
jgi:hypothetical protein